MESIITTHGQLIVRSETETEDFAVRVWAMNNARKFRDLPMTVCFDHEVPLAELVAQSRSEAEAEQAEDDFP